MTTLSIALTCADYARVMPLVTREVEPDGVALTMILGTQGSWPARAEMLRRAVQDPEVHGGEWSQIAPRSRCSRPKPSASASRPG